METPIKIETKLVIISLHEVDTLNERFTAEIYIESRWPMEYEESNVIDFKTITKNWKPKWVPNLEILNLISKEKSKSWYKISELNKKIYIFEMKRLKGKIIILKISHLILFFPS
jgi:hypothetical protein